MCICQDFYVHLFLPVEVDEPYIFHLLFVMSKGRNEKENIVGVLHDLIEEHNMDISRLSNPTQKDYDRLGKYKKSYNYLKS